MVYYIEMIILFIIDGVLADYLKKKNLKNFQYLFNNSAWSLNMKISYPSITEPSISAIFHGVDATFLGAYYDNKKYGSYHDYPKDAINIFQALQPHTSAIIGTWTGFTGQLADPSYVEDLTYKSKELDLNVIDNACTIIKNNLYHFLIVYLEGPDHTGHDYGVGDEYKDELKVVDDKLGQLLKVIDKKRDTLFIVSDHGRSTHYKKGKEHHIYSYETMKVPFFAYGKHIKKGEIDDNYLHTTDIAPTILKLSHKTIPHSMRGRIMKNILV